MPPEKVIDPETEIDPDADPAMGICLVIEIGAGVGGWAEAACGQRHSRQCGESPSSLSAGAGTE